MEQPFAFARTERLWQLLLTLETLASFPVEVRPESPLTPELRASYDVVIARATTTGLLHPADVEVIRYALSTWPEHSKLQREIIHALIDDCDALQSDAIALDKAVKLLSAWRRSQR